MYVKRKKIAACIEKHTNFLQWGGLRQFPTSLLTTTPLVMYYRGGGRGQKDQMGIRGSAYFWASAKKIFFQFRLHFIFRDSNLPRRY